MKRDIPDIRPLASGDLAEAERIYRLAFGTHKALPNPMDHGGDTNVTKCRFEISPEETFGAWLDGRLVGTNFLTVWGSVAFFGPVSVEPALWNGGIAKALVDASLNRAADLGATFLGIFTFSDSVKHLATYQRFGFMPRQLTIMMARATRSLADAPPPLLFSKLDGPARETFLARARELAGGLHPGLDLTREIEATTRLNLGDTVIVENGGELMAFAVFQTGAGSEGGSGVLYVKFGAARMGETSAADFAALVDACDRQAAALGLSKVAAGINTSRSAAYRQMLDSGFYLLRTGVAMHRPDVPAYNRADVFALDDWR